MFSSVQITSNEEYWVINKLSDFDFEIWWWIMAISQNLITSVTGKWLYNRIFNYVYQPQILFLDWQTNTTDFWKWAGQSSCVYVFLCLSYIHMFWWVNDSSSRSSSPLGQVQLSVLCHMKCLFSSCCPI